MLNFDDIFFFWDWVNVDSDCDGNIDGESDCMKDGANDGVNDGEIVWG